MEKKEILMHLRSFIESKKGTATETDKKAIRTLTALEEVTEEDITVGDEPKYFNAYIECNSTGVGESSFGGTQTRRTVALDYTTDTHLFVDGHMGAAQKGLSLFVLKPGQTTAYYSKEDIVKVAKTHGYNLHAQKFRDLNFIITDHRLNRYDIKVTKGPTSYPIRPIIATVNDKGDTCTIGYLYEKDGAEYIIIEPDDISAAKASSNSFGCAPWMFLGFVFPPIFFVALIVMFAKFQKERMIG